MLDLKEMHKKAIDRGYNLSSREDNGSMFHYTKDNGLGLLIFPNTDEFQLYLRISLVGSLRGCLSGSFMNDKDFARMEKDIEQYINLF